MLILSKALVSIDRQGRVRVEGALERHAAKIRTLAAEAGLRGATIRHLFGRYVFSRAVRPEMRQRLRNFLLNECPLGG